jgi:hypothetical protein
VTARTLRRTPETGALIPLPPIGWIGLYPGRLNARTGQLIVTPCSAKASFAIRKLSTAAGTPA